MAKGLRSKSNKVNKAKLRHHVFEPAEQARKERLSTKLKELAFHTHKKENDAKVTTDKC